MLGIGKRFGSSGVHDPVWFHANRQTQAGVNEFAGGTNIDERDSVFFSVAGRLAAGDSPGRFHG